MPQKRFLQYIRDLSFEEKLVMWGSVLCFISAFLPWYRDIDRFGTGFQFLGITGPLYLVGLFFAALGLTIFGTLFIKRVRQKILDFGFQMTNFYLLSAGFLLFLLILTNSVYFHENFGVNITSKEFRFGMLIGFIGVGLLFVGTFLQRRSRGLSLNIEDILSDNVGQKPLVELPGRPHQPLEPSSNPSNAASKPESEYSQTDQGRII